MRRICAALLLLALPGCGGPRASSPAAAPAAIPVQFRDVTARSGITFRHRFGGFGKKYFVESSGSGLCFFDYDNDGDPDLYVVQAGTLPTRPGYGGAENRSALYRNDGGGHFTDVTDQAGVPNLRYGQGACAGDYNNDGLLDLFVTSYGANRLYQNNGNGTFTDRSKEAGLAGQLGGLNLLQTYYDNDGHRDILVLRGGW